MCKLHGVRLIKGIKIFESMRKKFSTSTNWSTFIIKGVTVRNVNKRFVCIFKFHICKI